MDFLSVLTSISGDNIVGGFISVLNIAMFIWILIIYIPGREKEHTREREKRDSEFLQVINTYRETIEDIRAKEEESHREIIRLIHDHDKHTLEANLKIAQILEKLRG